VLGELSIPFPVPKPHIESPLQALVRRSERWLGRLDATPVTLPANPTAGGYLRFGILIGSLWLATVILRIAPAGLNINLSMATVLAAIIGLQFTIREK
jgi:hypothetical protein